jgi:hypothetical protein
MFSAFLDIVHPFRWLLRRFHGPGSMRKCTITNFELYSINHSPMLMIEMQSPAKFDESAIRQR